MNASSELALRFNDRRVNALDFCVGCTGSETYVRSIFQNSVDYFYFIE